MPSAYDFYMCDAPADDEDEALYEMIDAEIDQDFPELEGDERAAMIEQRIAEWKAEQDNRYDGFVTLW